MSKKQFDHRAYHHFNNRRTIITWVIVLAVVTFAYFVWDSYQPSWYLRTKCEKSYVADEPRLTLWKCPPEGNR